MNFYFIASRQKYKKKKKRSTLLPSTFNKINRPLIIFHVTKVLLKNSFARKKRKKTEGSY